MRLTDQQRELFVMMYEGGGSVAQISGVIGFPPEQFLETRKVNDIPLRLQDTKRLGGKLVAPDGLLKDAKSHTLSEMARKYQLGRGMIKSILIDNGVHWIDGESKRTDYGRSSNLVRQAEAAQTIYDRAAQFLRRYKHNVYRCDIKIFEHQRVTWGDLNNLPHHGTKHYFVDGFGVVAQDRMLEIARGTGFAEELSTSNQ
jgi:hypothetical protein